VPSTSSAGEGSAPAGVQYNTEFGYSRKDVLIIIVALIGAGVLMYEGLQAAGMDAGMAGNWVQLVIFLGICVGWVSTYLWRVANKVRCVACLWHARTRVIGCVQVAAVQGKARCLAVRGAVPRKTQPC
jgi:hypothetical protein